MVLPHDMRNLAAHFEEIGANDEVLRTQNVEMIGVLREKAAHATAKSAWLKAVTEKLVSVKSNLAAR